MDSVLWGKTAERAGLSSEYLQRSCAHFLPCYNAVNYMVMVGIAS